MNFIEIQSWPQIPSIGFFVSLFSKSFNLPDIDIEDLEEALLLDSSESNSIDDTSAAELAPRLVPELIVSLLRGCDLVKSWPNITTSNYQMFLRRLFRQKSEEYDIENPFNTDTDFHCLSLHTKVVILNYLCDFRLDSADVESITSGFEADSLRIEPLGEDATGSVYWYFYGTRLYREDFKKRERIWQVICFTEQDWQNLANKFKLSKSRKESALYRILTEDFLPNIPVLFKAKEAERRRRLFQRRSSQRVKVIHERQKSKKFGEDDLPAVSEEDEDNQLSGTEKYLEEKQKKLLAQAKLRHKIQQDRALRAQRRSSSLSSSSSSKSSCGPRSFETAFTETHNHSLSNKENILHSDLKSITKFTSLPNKMPPTSTKLPGRQTNNSLSSITGQIVIQPPATNSPGPSTSRKKKVKPEVFMETDEVLQIGMHKVLQHVKNHDDAWPFMDPVEEEIAPRYYSIIKRPMDLLKMEEKLDNCEYRSFTEFRTDFKLIVNNCRLYNGQTNEYTEMVNNLQLAFDRSTKKYFDQTSSDEEPVLLEYPPIEATASKPSTGSKEKEMKKEKLKAKEKKHLKPSAADLSTDDEEKSDEKVSHKKIKDSKKNSVESIKKTDKKSVANDKKSVSSDKKKEKSTKGVKRKHKDKDKSDKPKAKKIKRDFSDGENEDFDFNSDHSNNDNESEIEGAHAHDPKKKVKNGKKLEKSSEKSKEKSSSSAGKKTKKSEIVKQTSGKRKEKSPVLPDNKSDSKKKVAKKDASPQKSEKFSKTNEKANIKKRKLEKTFDDDSDSDCSVHDLIEEKKVVDVGADSKKVESSKKSKSKVDDVKHSDKKSRALASTPKKGGKKNSAKKLDSNKKSTRDDQMSMSSGSFSRSPSPLPSINSLALTEDLTSSFDYEKGKLDSSFRSDTPEIKDKFDLIKERRNKINQEKEREKAKKRDHQSSSQQKEKNQKLKETIEKLKKNKSQIELMDEVLGGKSVKKESNNLFDKLKNETTPVKVKGLSKKHESSGDQPEKAKTKKPKSEKKEEKSKVKGEEKPSTAIAVAQNSKCKKQNKASLDVLDMETEQTLKDINKWLEHTPRFEYSSASNSPSRYIIDEIEMPSKMDDNDFRKPIPLMPSSPSASHANFQSPQNTPKDFNLLKESNNNKQSAASQNANSVAGTSNKKVGSKEPKRKSLKDKLQQLPRKKEVQRTIDRLQPGKTKGNLLHNIQNINKPEEFFPLGNREKVKEVKNSLIVQTDDSSPKLSLGTVLDTQSFNFDSDTKKQDNDCFDEPSLKIEDDDEKNEKVDEDSFSKKIDEIGDKLKDEIGTDSADATKGGAEKKSTASDSVASKPNVNAWFKAFGAPKKPKKSEDDSGKTSDNSDAMKIEGSYLPTHQRRLSTGSSVSERSSVEDSPQVGLEERLGGVAPYPSPMGASPIMASPKTDDQKASAANYPVNGSIGRVGFYQDMTSTKSSPDKSCSPREMPSPYSQYSQQHLYSGAGSSSGAGMYGNFYNPENAAAGKQAGQASYSKPTTSPASYYDQYKQPMSQESEFNNSMSPSTNPNSPYHSQQSSPYQQQPNSPFHSPSGGANASASQAPNSPYSQPSSPYQQPQQSSFQHQSSSSSSSNSSQTQKPPAQNQPPASFNNQSGVFPQLGPNSSFNQQQQQHQGAEQFSPSAQQNCAKPDWNKPVTSDASSAYTLSQQQQQAANTFNLTSQQAQVHHPNIANPSAPHHLNIENAFQQNQGNYNKKEPQSSGTPSTTPLYGTGKLPDLPGSNYSGVDMVTKNKESVAPVNKQQVENAKYLDLSKQQPTHLNQQQASQYHQQMFDLSNYSKAPLDLNKPVDMFNRGLPKNNLPMTAASCAASPGFWGNPAKAIDPVAYGQNDPNKPDGKSTLNSLLNNPAGNTFLNNSVSHQQAARNPQAPTSMDLNYKQQLFNNPAASSMMDLTAFMRDFRQAEERFSTLSGASSSFYDKTITPAHMFGKNLPQANSSAALQQMFNSSISTMAYNREQQNMNLASYHNRLNPPQSSVANANQSHASVAPQAVETKAKKSRKKKNASPDVTANNQQAVAQHHQTQSHQTQSHQHAQHQQLQHQQLAHQQSFQSYSGLKIPSAGATDPSAISLKSVVPGSAFNYGPTPLAGIYGENPAYLEEFRGTTNPYYPPPGLGHRSTPDPVIDKTSTNPPPAHPQAPSSPYHHLLPPHHPSRSSYPFMNSIDPAALQQQYRMMLNQTYQAGYHPALGMHNQPPHWGHHM